MKKRILAILLITFFVLTGCSANNSVKDENINADGKIHFTDDYGQEIVMDEPAKRIISLYSAHTENLFSLGLDDEIIGIGKSDAFPPQIRTKEIFDYRSDPEKVIAADPDLVLVRPFINRGNPDFIESLKKANIPVVSLYPEKFDDFSSYIEKLALLTGTSEKAEELLEDFHADLAFMEEKMSKMDPKVNVYFESTETEYRTITEDSMAAKAIKLAGGKNIATDAEALREGTSIAGYGAERILEKAEKIDVFVSQRGAMNSGGNKHSIAIRPGFSAIKAVKEDRVYTIDEKFVSSPSFRFSVGVHELARMFYPEEMDKWEDFAEKDDFTRADLAEACVLFKHKAFFTPNSKYYAKKHDGHVYGDFSDVEVANPKFHYIETACMSGYIYEDGKQFQPERKVTREELAQSLYMLTDLKEKANSIKIQDLNNVENSRIIQIVVDNGLLKLKNNQFKADDYVTGSEVVQALEKIKELEA